MTNASQPSPARYEAALRYTESRDRLDRRLAPLGMNAQVLWTGAFLVSLALSFGLIITSFCFWNRHRLPGRILSIVAGVLLIPSICCGLWPVG